MVFIALVVGSLALSCKQAIILEKKESKCFKDFDFALDSLFNETQFDLSSVCHCDITKSINSVAKVCGPELLKEFQLNHTEAFIEMETLVHKSMCETKNNNICINQIANSLKKIPKPKSTSFISRFKNIPENLLCQDCMKGLFYKIYNFATKIQQNVNPNFEKTYQRILNSTVVNLDQKCNIQIEVKSSALKSTFAFLFVLINLY